MRLARVCLLVVIRRIGGLEVPDVTTSAHVIVIRRIGGLEEKFPVSKNKE